MNEKEAFQVLAQMEIEGKTNNFLESLLEQYPRRGWSERQFYWAKENAQREVDRREREKAAEDMPQFSGLDAIRAMLQMAKDAGKAKPFIVLEVEETEYRISLTSEKASIGAGTVTVYNDRREWIGYIVDGTTRFSGGDVELLHAMQALALDPVAAAQRYAHATGRCMFCRLTLTVEESIKRSYGPVCAKNHGLPFDFVAYRRKTGVSV